MTTDIPSTFSTLEWANPPAETLPRLVTESPGPNSRSLHARMERHQRRQTSFVARACQRSSLSISA